MQAIPLPVLRLFAVLLLGTSLTCAVGLVCFARRASLRHWLLQYHGSIERDLAFLRLSSSGHRLLIAQGGVLAACVVCALAGHFVLASLGLALVLYVRPYLMTRRARRITQLEAQLDGWLLSLASLLRASPALGDALERTLGVTSPPLRDELTLLCKECELGAPLDQALSRLGARVGSRTLQSALAALRIARNAGGELSVTLERAAATLREMARLEGVVRTKTAEAKAQAWVLGAVPFFVVALLHHMNPAFLAPLFASTRGHAVLLAAFVSWSASIVLSRSILDVDL